MVELSYHFFGSFDITFRIENNDGIGPDISLKGAFLRVNLIKYLDDVGGVGIYKLKTFLDKTLVQPVYKRFKFCKIFCGVTDCLPSGEMAQYET
jgi:hypothetical protein